VQIPPIGSGSLPSNSPSKDPVVQKYYDLWTAWYNDPHEDSSLAEGKELLNFLMENHDHFLQLASGKPLPHPSLSFERSYDTAIRYLNGWINHEGKTTKTPPSQFIKDVYEWISYVNQ
jgi:hypothetical protein